MAKNLFMTFGALLVLTFLFFKPELLKAPAAPGRAPSSTDNPIQHFMDVMKTRDTALKDVEEASNAEPEYAENWTCNCIRPAGSKYCGNDDAKYPSMLEAINALRAGCGEDCEPNCFVGRTVINR